MKKLFVFLVLMVALCFGCIAPNEFVVEDENVLNNLVETNNDYNVPTNDLSDNSILESNLCKEFDINGVVLDVEQFDLPSQWIIFEELDKNVEKKIEVIYDNNVPKQIQLVGFTHSKPCQSGGIQDNAFWIQVWFILCDGNTVMDPTVYQQGDNYREILTLDISRSNVVNDYSKIGGIIIVDVAKNFEQTKIILTN
jgi:hypothetical protein